MTTQTIDAPALPQAPTGHFWRITDLVWVSYPDVGPFQMHSDDTLVVELRRELPPTRFRKRERSDLITSEEVKLNTQENAVYTPGELAARAAVKIMDARAISAASRARIKQVLGDYR